MTPFELRLEIIKFSYEYLRNNKPQTGISIDEIIAVAKQFYSFVDAYKI